jgi:hypothetical protein
MRVYDVIAESDIDEAPASALGQFARKVGAKGLAKIGMKKTAQGMAGKVDFNDRANKMYDAFMKYLSRTGGNMKEPTADELMDYLETQKLPTVRVQKLSGVIAPKDLNGIFVSIAQDSFKGKRGQSAAGGAAKAEPGLGQEFGFSDQDGDGKDDKTGKPAPAGGAGGGTNVNINVPGGGGQQAAPGQATDEPAAPATAVSKDPSKPKISPETMELINQIKQKPQLLAKFKAELQQ